MSKRTRADPLQTRAAGPDVHDMDGDPGRRGETPEGPEEPGVPARTRNCTPRARCTRTFAVFTDTRTRAISSWLSPPAASINGSRYSQGEHAHEGERTRSSIRASAFGATAASSIGPSRTDCRPAAIASQVACHRQKVCLRGLGPDRVSADSRTQGRFGRNVGGCFVDGRDYGVHESSGGRG